MVRVIKDGTIKEPSAPIQAQPVQQPADDTIQKCRDEINATLEKYDCTIYAEFRITPQGNQPVVIVVKKQQPQAPIIK